jgi:hypothetical protein
MWCVPPPPPPRHADQCVGQPINLQNHVHWVLGYVNLCAIALVICSSFCLATWYCLTGWWLVVSKTTHTQNVLYSVCQTYTVKMLAWFHVNKFGAVIIRYQGPFCIVSLVYLNWNLHLPVNMMVVNVSWWCLWQKSHCWRWFLMEVIFLTWHTLKRWVCDVLLHAASHSATAKQQLKEEACLFIVPNENEM